MFDQKCTYAVMIKSPVYLWPLSILKNPGHEKPGACTRGVLRSSKNANPPEDPQSAPQA